MNRKGSPLVLVIEDDADLRALYREVFEGEGWGVATIPSPDTHLGWMRVYAPDAVVLDLNFRGDTEAGIRFLRRLRADVDGAGIPVVVCSGAWRLLRRHEVEFAQLDATVVPKPFDLGELLRAVHRPPSRSA